MHFFLQRTYALYAGFIVAATLLWSCTSNNDAALKPAKKTIAWDTVKIEAAVNNYLKTHEKYYNLIDSISYWIDTLSHKEITYDQSNYFRLMAMQTDEKDTHQLVVTPGTEPSNIPVQKPNQYYDSANFYIEKCNRMKNEPLIGFRVFVRYRLSDVMLTYSDFTPYLFYLDTAYYRMEKSNFLHYTNIPIKRPDESGIYLDIPNPYISPKQ